MPLLERLHDALHPLPSPIAADGKVVLDEHDPFSAHAVSFDDPSESLREVEILTFIRVGMRISIRVKREGCIFETLLGVRKGGM